MYTVVFSQAILTYVEEPIGTLLLWRGVYP